MTDKAFPRMLQLTLGALLSVPSLAAAAASEIEWDDIHFNPVPIDGDFILPLPCGGAMAFRRVETGADGAQSLLADQLVSMGQASTPVPHVEAQIRSSVAGGLMDQSSRYYLMGKYEVTRRQYSAVVESDCSDPGDDGDLPVAGLSWFNAVEFTWKLNEWLIAEASEALPQSVDGGRALIRLPTEPEWEFAVRGGLRVNDVDRAQRLHPMDGPLEEYAWFAGPASSGGNLQYVGALKPNPLGLHDMLGHVGEIMLEPFQLRRGSRPHGASGGFVIRGGGISTSRDAISVASRSERAYFRDGGAPDTATDVGMRAMISATLLNSTTQSDALAAAFRSIEERRAEFDSPIQALRELRERGLDALDADALARLELEVQNIESELERAADLAAERADHALESLILSGALLQRSMNVTAQLASGHYRNLDRGTETIRELSQRNFDREADQFDQLRSGHADLVHQVAREYDQFARRRAVDRLWVTLRERDQLDLVRFSEDFDNLAHLYSVAGGFSGCELAIRAVGELDWFEC